MNFLKELKRRNVFRVAIAYLVIAWLLAQVSATLESALNMPDWFDTMVVSLLLIGFPIALFFAWVFELTPEGIKREKDINRDESIVDQTSKKLNYVTIIAALAVLGMFVWQQMNPSNDSSLRVNDEVGQGKNEELVKGNNESIKNSIIPTQVGTPNDESAEPIINTNTIAVLPFADMSKNKDQEYFSDGITEEILNVLVGISELQITSRTSAFSFKKTNTDIITIAKRLRVAYILVGSIRKSGEKVRITAQLVDTKTDTSLWSETYDRELTDIFKVQDEIAVAIVKALRETLGISINKPEFIAKNINPRAHDLYLKGQQQLYNNSFDSLTDAAESFNASLKIEADFSLAKIALARTLINQVSIGSENNPDILKQAENLIQTVLAKEPEMPQAYLVLNLLADTKGETEQQRQFINKAYQLNPNNAMSIVYYVRLNKETISNEESIKLFNKALEIDPLNAEIPFRISYYYKEHPKTRKQVEYYFKRAIELNPSNGSYSFLLGKLYGESFADLSKAIKYFNSYTKTDSKDPDSLIYLSFTYNSLGDSKTALDFSNKAIEIHPNSAEAFVSMASSLILKGENQKALKLINQVSNNLEIFHRESRFTHGFITFLGVHILLQENNPTAAIKLVDKFKLGRQNFSNTNDPMVLALLSSIYRAQGKEQLANQLAEKLEPLIQKFTLGTFTIEKNEKDFFQAILLTAQNKQEQAIDYLTNIIDDGFRLNWRTKIQYNPLFTSLHQNPRYKKLIQRIEANVLDQRKNIERNSHESSVNQGN